MQFTVPFIGTKVAIGNTTEGVAPRSRQTGEMAIEAPYGDMRGVRLDMEDLYTIWRNNTDVYSCVRKIRQTACIGGVFYYNPSDESQETPADEKAKNSVIDVLSYYYGDPRRFKNEVYKHQGIGGNTYLEKVRSLEGNQPIGLKVLDSRTMSIVYDKHGTIIAYIQGADEFFSSKSSKEDVVVFQPEDIIHWKLEIDPDNEAFGMSWLEAAIWEARIDLSAMVGNYRLQMNDSTPATQYILDDNIGEEEEKAVVDKLRKYFKGPQNRGRSIAMKGIKEIKTVRLTPQELEMLSGRKFSTEKVCSASGVPKVLIGYTEGVNYTNHEGQMQDFYDSTVTDYDLSYTQLINVDIIEDFLGLDNIKFKVKPPIFEARSEVWTRAIKARESGLATINDARAMVGEDPIDPALHADVGDRIILGSGGNARFATDVGIDPAYEDDQLKEVREALELAASRNNGDDA